MTRINTVDPKYITDKMLQAEYFELPRIFTLVRKAINRGEKPNLLDPPQYTMGKGHVRFFYPRLDFLLLRYKLVINELTVRGRNLAPVPSEELIQGIGPEWMTSNWLPDTQAVARSLGRLEERKGLIRV